MIPHSSRIYILLSSTKLAKDRLAERVKSPKLLLQACWLRGEQLAQGFGVASLTQSKHAGRCALSKKFLSQHILS